MKFGLLGEVVMQIEDVLVEDYERLAPRALNVGDFTVIANLWPALNIFKRHAIFF